MANPRQKEILKTTVEYDAQIGMNGKDLSADTPAKLLAQIRSWKKKK